VTFLKRRRRFLVQLDAVIRTSAASSSNLQQIFRLKINQWRSGEGDVVLTSW
jgi:hypothetical protein